jgi:histidine decarboxylase
LAPASDPVTKTSATLSPRLESLYQDLCSKRERFIGYPINQFFPRNIDYTPLYPFLSFASNNYGDPFHYSNYGINTHCIEKTVLSAFASLLGTSLHEAWGYVTSGTTESHIFSLYAARERFDCPESSKEPVVYYSEASHSSVAKAIRLLRMHSKPIRATDSGELDYSSLATAVDGSKPAIVIANIGTTMTGAIDSLPRIHSILDKAGVPGRYIHADAALSGMILPFISEEPQPFRFTDGIDSIAISGHKMIGSPIPCGVCLVRREHITHLQRSDSVLVEYVRCLDTTITSSRPGFTPLVFYHALRTLDVLGENDELGSRAGMKRMVSEAIDTAEYAVQCMRDKGIDAWRHRNSLTVVFPRTVESVEKKWFLAGQAGVSHVIAMPGVRREQIDGLVDDLVKATNKIENGSRRRKREGEDIEEIERIPMVKRRKVAVVG